MATNSGDLAQALIQGGLAPQAASIIANAIANASSPTLSRGGDTTDATPTDALRLITPNIRRYQLTNLDYSPSEPFQQRISTRAGTYEARADDHPYKDSQPVNTAPPLSSPRVQGGYYVDVSNAVEGGAAVSVVDLKLRSEQGRHLRLDTSTRSLDAVGFAASTESPKVLGAEVRETEAGTEIVISLRNLVAANVLLGNADTRQALIFSQSAAVGPATLAAGGTRSLSSVNVRLESGESQNLLVWTNGGTSPAPAGPAGTLKAWAVFDGTSSTTVGASLTVDAKSASVSSITRVAAGKVKVNLASGTFANANYCVVATSSTGADNEPRVVNVRDVATNDFVLQFVDTGSSTVNPANTNAGTARVNVAVFS